MTAIRIVTPVVTLALQDLRELQQDHAVNGYRLTSRRGPRLALDGDPEALVGALLKLSLEALTIHLLAEAEPDRPVAEILDQAVHQLRRS